jgi:hypothetical protein
LKQLCAASQEHHRAIMASIRLTAGGCRVYPALEPSTTRRETMSNQLTEAELAALMPSELCTYQTPIPTQIVSSDEFYPDPQNERQREVEARLLAMADDLGGK